MAHETPTAIQTNQHQELWAAPVVVSPDMQHFATKCCIPCHHPEWDISASDNDIALITHDHGVGEARIERNNAPQIPHMVSC
jgi:hypothetical protein